MLSSKIALSTKYQELPFGLVRELIDCSFEFEMVRTLTGLELNQLRNQPYTDEFDKLIKYCEGFMEAVQKPSFFNGVYRSEILGIKMPKDVLFKSTGQYWDAVMTLRQYSNKQDTLTFFDSARMILAIYLDGEKNGNYDSERIPDYFDSIDDLPFNVVMGFFNWFNEKKKRLRNLYLREVLMIPVQSLLHRNLLAWPKNLETSIS